MIKKTPALKYLAGVFLCLRWRDKPKDFFGNDWGLYIPTKVVFLTTVFFALLALFKTAQQYLIVVFTDLPLPFLFQLLHHFYRWK